MAPRRARVFPRQLDRVQLLRRGGGSGKGFIFKLEREKEWATQEERKAKGGRTTRSSDSITHVSTVRRLSVVLSTEDSVHALLTLFRVTSDFVALELTTNRFTGLDDALSDRALSHSSSLWLG